MLSKLEAFLDLKHEGWVFRFITIEDQDKKENGEKLGLLTNPLTPTCFVLFCFLIYNIFNDIVNYFNNFFSLV